ncbi:PIN domain-containing protein [Brachybacterium sacelli]|uniref:Nucleic acid-binding protein n=1 Tax=Brachybacterium sacelli TaxID=173364 RepID=A0ABS4X9P1_9MICO|nr:putative nucleic acid-binding protein [Brachybacterium sacelli]
MSDAAAGSIRVAVLDACALVPIRLATTLLWLSEAGIFELLWSDRILDEVQRNLPKLGISEEKAAHRVSTMRDAFGEAALVDDFDHLIADMTCDPKDRHVLAAAVRAEADTLVTFNLKDFPPDSTSGWQVDAIHPDTFLTGLLAEDPVGVVEALRRGSADLRNPAQTATDFLASLTGTVPILANLAADQIRSRDESPDEPSSPITALVSADQDEAVAAFGEAGDLTDPAQIALQWWTVLDAETETARELTFAPSAWGDYQWAIDMLADKSLASRVIPAVDEPDRIAFMRFIPEVATTAQAFAAYATTVTFLTLVRLDDGTWRVWGLGPALLAARDIVGDA